jgi:site-specific recombinase XerD
MPLLHVPPLLVARERAADVLGVSERTLEGLVAAGEMVNGGVDLYTVGKVLGHRDARSTQRYAHLTTETLTAAVGTIGKKKRA